ncbi:MAG: protein kinase, partial [Erysipelothrix sp.]
MNEMISNRYLLVKKIGSGGMADVYLAMDTVLNREVALKKLRGDLSHDPVALLRFQREANAASGINHPNIVEIYDVGQDGDQHYIVMEVVRGTTLKQLVQRRGALDKYEAVAITKQLASGLVKAHDSGVIHRDVKPQNVLIKDDGTVKITDFGIALAGDALQLTRDDSVLGSVHYMAPECSRGEGASIQSDVYSLGVVFFELLTGTLPFRGETPVEIAMKHLRDPFPSILEFNPTLPNSLENIIAKSTHKNRTYRYTNMHEFLDDLETCLFENRKDEPLWQPEEETDDETKVINKLDAVDRVEGKKPKNRKKLWITLSAVLIVSLGIFTYWFFSPSKSSTVELPDLTKMTVNEAEAILKENGLIYNSSNLVHIYSDDLESGY